MTKFILWDQKSSNVFSVNFSLISLGSLQEVLKIEFYIVTKLSPNILIAVSFESIEKKGTLWKTY